MSCIFCKIVKKEITPHVVYEDDVTMAFLDINPINTGHILVIPKRHVLDLDEIENNEINHIFVVTKKILKAIKANYSCDGYSIMTNGGIFNDIGHLHIHVFPRKKNDSFGWRYSNVESEIDTKNLPKLRAYLSKNEI